jgi:integrase
MESLADLAAAIPDLIIEVPNRRNWYSLRLDELLPSLRADLEAWLSADQGADPRLRRARLNRNQRRRHRKPIRPSTAASYLRLILEFITMEVKAGIPLESLETLADVVDPDNIDRGLAEFENHFNGQKRTHLGQAMRIICLLARHWVGLDAELVSELWSWTKDVSVPRQGMTAKNKKVVIGLKDKRTLARILGLGFKLLREAAASPILSRRKAIEGQIGFLMVLLLNAPGRIGNIGGIHLDRHVRIVGSGADRRVFIEFPEAEVKNNRALLYELTAPTIEAFDLYMGRIRPKYVQTPDNRWLFPGEGNGHKGTALLSEQLADMTSAKAGIRLTAHQYRHLRVFLHLRRSRFDITTVAKALGHDEATCRKFYAWISDEEALANWDETLKLTQEELAPLIEGTAPKPPRRRRGKS